MKYLYSKKNRSHRTTLKIKGIEIGGKGILIIAGPCSIRSRKTLDKIANTLSKMKVKAIRGGAFKLRTSPYNFQGLGEEGLKILKEVCDKYNLISISEILSVEQVPMFVKNCDIIQVGARNMRNYHLLKALGKINKPIMLKRDMSATYEEWLYAAEYILSNGNPNVILCERGIVGFNRQTRNLLDIVAVPYLKQKTHLPVFVDPSHATGKRELVFSAAMSAIAAGVDGLLIESSYKPQEEFSDARQTITLNTLNKIINTGNKVAKAFNRYLI